MDGSSLNLIMDDLDHINLGYNEASDFSMRVLDSKSKRAELGIASVSHGLKRSISNAVERNVNTNAMDIFEVRRFVPNFLGSNKSFFKYLSFEHGEEY